MGSLAKHRIVWFDLETGGLDPDKHQIIELAAVATNGETFEEVGALHIRLQLVEGKYTKEALAINHYDPELWKGALTAQEGLHEFCEFLREHATMEKEKKDGSGYYKVAMLGGHNILNFDIPFILAWKTRFKVWLPAGTWHGGVFDSLHLVQAFRLVVGEDPASLKLKDCCDHFGIEGLADMQHTALGDVRATVSLVRAITERLRG
jgi:DNA polymerase III subunit epsilon